MFCFVFECVRTVRLVFQIKKFHHKVCRKIRIKFKSFPFCPAFNSFMGRFPIVTLSIIFELSCIPCFLDVRVISVCVEENSFVCTYMCTLSVSFTFDRQEEVRGGSN